MIRIALVTPEFHDRTTSERRGSGTLSYQFAGLLAANGYDVTILVASLDKHTIDPMWEAQYRTKGIDVISVEHITSMSDARVWDSPERIALPIDISVALGQQYDVIYFTTIHSDGFHFLRQRRFREQPWPVCVTLIHDDAGWHHEEPDQYPRFPVDFCRDFEASYIKQHSDFVVSHSQAVLDHYWKRGHKFPDEACVRVMQFPTTIQADKHEVKTPLNDAVHFRHVQWHQQWLSFQNELDEWVRQRRIAHGSSPHAADASITQAEIQPVVDVCISHYNHGHYLPQLLLSLEHQTTDVFNVIVVDDGSTDSKSKAVFRQMKQQYRSRGWQFIEQNNGGPSVARNQAAQRGHAPFIIFIDSDDVVPRNMVERLLKAIRLSGDDSLAPYGIAFKSDDFPYDLATGRMTVNVHQHFPFLGSSLVTNLAGNFSGGVTMIVRREIFEALEGFKGGIHDHAEDLEFHMRLAMAGYRSDVLPEYLYYYRRMPGSRMTQVTQEPAGKLRLRLRIEKTYRDQLNQVGLGNMAMAVLSLQQQMEEAQHRARQSQTELDRLHTLDDAAMSNDIKDLNHRIRQLETEFEQELAQMQMQIDAQNEALNRPPKLVDWLRGLYWFIIPLRLRLAFRDLRHAIKHRILH